MQRLERRKKLLTLRREIAQLEGEEGPVSDSRGAVPRRPRYDYTQIKNAISKFTGADSFGAVRWLEHFERLMDSVQIDDGSKLLFARGAMDGSAGKWAFTCDATTWTDFRAAFLREFDRRISVTDVLYAMSRERYDPAGLRAYIIQMDLIAQRGPGIDEPELVRQIVAGLRDRTGDAAFMNYADSLDQLKHLADKYDRIRREATVRAAHSNVNVTKKNIPGSKPTSGNSANSTNSVKRVATANTDCFNCSGLGHFSADCPLPRRAKSSCFRCGSMEHRVANCPKPPSPGRVALIPSEKNSEPRPEDSVDDAAAALSATNLVSVAFKVGRKFCAQTDRLIS